MKNLIGIRARLRSVEEQYKSAVEAYRACTPGSRLASIAKAHADTLAKQRTLLEAELEVTNLELSLTDVFGIARRIVQAKYLQAKKNLKELQK